MPDGTRSRSRRNASGGPLLPLLSTLCSLDESGRRTGEAGPAVSFAAPMIAFRCAASARRRVMTSIRIPETRVSRVNEEKKPCSPTRRGRSGGSSFRRGRGRTGHEQVAGVLRQGGADRPDETGMMPLKLGANLLPPAWKVSADTLTATSTSLCTPQAVEGSGVIDADVRAAASGLIKLFYRGSVCAFFFVDPQGQASGAEAAVVIGSKGAWAGSSGNDEKPIRWPGRHGWLAQSLVDDLSCEDLQLCCTSESIPSKSWDARPNVRLPVRG